MQISLFFSCLACRRRNQLLPDCSSLECYLPLFSVQQDTSNFDIKNIYSLQNTGIITDIKPWDWLNGNKLPHGQSCVEIRGQTRKCSQIFVWPPLPLTPLAPSISGRQHLGFESVSLYSVVGLVLTSFFALLKSEKRDSKQDLPSRASSNVGFLYKAQGLEIELL